MKRIVYLSLSLFFAGVVLVSCNKNTPSQVAETWLTGFNHMDFDEPMKVSTPETKNLLASLEELTSKVSDSAKKEMKNVKVKIKDVKVNGDIATATYTTSDNPRDQTLTIVKQNDKWLVQFTKSDMVGGIESKKDEQAPVAEEAVPDTTHVAPSAAPPGQ